MPGSLFVVATPIGNLEDLTFRALRTLKEVDLIAAEDTRRTSRLLAHYGVSRPLVSLHEHNEHRDAPRLAQRIAEGQSIALVSDAGTPAISDPGSTLVRLCRAAGLPVVAIPGPSAITAALSVTGLPAVPFTFMGFPPTSGQSRERWFDSLADAPGLIVFFEAPHRIRVTLKRLVDFVDRPIFVHREISKIHESLVEWKTTTDMVTDTIEDRGEFVIVLGPASQIEVVETDERSLLTVYQHLATLDLVGDDQLLAATAAAFGLKPQRVRNIIKKATISAKRQNDPYA